jgi:heme/copper-type cytochrome/quinol oxidase subunit 2
VRAGCRNCPKAAWKNTNRSCLFRAGDPSSAQQENSNSQINFIMTAVAIMVGCMVVLLACAIKNKPKVKNKKREAYLWKK